MPRKQRKTGQGGLGAAPHVDREEFAASLERRGRAARGLEQDLLTSVSLLYGAPGQNEPGGDPGIALAKIHSEEMLRRNAGGVFSSQTRPSDVALPFERAMLAFSLLVLAFLFFGD